MIYQQHHCNILYNRIGGKLPDRWMPLYFSNERNDTHEYVRKGSETTNPNLCLKNKRQMLRLDECSTALRGHGNAVGVFHATDSVYKLEAVLCSSSPDNIL